MKPPIIAIGITNSIDKVVKIKLNIAGGSIQLPLTTKYRQTHNHVTNTILITYNLYLTNTEK